MKRLAAVALLALLPFASAHVSNFSDTQAVADGDYSGSIGGTDYLFAGRQGTLQLLLVESKGGAYQSVGQGNVSYEATLGTVRLQGDMVQTAAGTWMAKATFPQAGSWSLSLNVGSQPRPVHLAATMPVYPTLGYLMTPADPLLDPRTNVTTHLQFRPVWYDTAQMATHQVPRDLTVRVERWTDDHKTLLHSEEIPANLEGDSWGLDYTFPDVGMYHIKFQSTSAGFSYANMPTQHVYVYQRGDPPAQDHGTVVLWIAFAAVSAAALWWGFKRTRKGR